MTDLSRLKELQQLTTEYKLLLENNFLPEDALLRSKGSNTMEFSIAGLAAYRELYLLMEQRIAKYRSTLQEKLDLMEFRKHYPVEADRLFNDGLKAGIENALWELIGLLQAGDWN